MSDGGDPLERLSKIVSFEDFRPHLEDALERKDRGLGGRPPMDAVMMFKILVLQSLYNLGDDAAEYLQTKQSCSKPEFIKLDVQGYELAVLDGGQRVLKSAEVVLMEVNLLEILEGAPLFHDVVSYGHL